MNAQKKDDKVIIQEQILDIFKDLNTKEVYIYNDVDRENLLIRFKNMMELLRM